MKKRSGFMLVVLCVLLLWAFPLIPASRAQAERLETAMDNIVTAFSQQDYQTLADFWVYPLERRT
ncbi:MAG TPA: hypothetical protein DDW87_09380 [Firmicutes bacterium]|nr:hypothetical protein [Bacillota bacterium]